jgi:ribosomal protein S8
MNKIINVKNILTSIKNGYSQNQKIVFCRKNEFNLKILFLLYKEGLIVDYKLEFDYLKIKLRYHNNKPLIYDIIMIYKSSLKKFFSYEEIKKFYRKYDLFFVSTSYGIISSNELFKFFSLNKKIGGQLLFGLQLMKL